MIHIRIARRTMEAMMPTTVTADIYEENVKTFFLACNRPPRAYTYYRNEGMGGESKPPTDTGTGGEREMMVGMSMYNSYSKQAWRDCSVFAIASCVKRDYRKYDVTLAVPDSGSDS